MSSSAFTEITMSKVPFCPILMGSKSDLKHCQAISDELTRFGIESEMRVSSAHKSPHRLLSVIEAYEAMGDTRALVYITCAGRSNALSGMADGAITGPVIACPPYSDKYGGSDVFSSIRMPGGVTPMLVADPKLAALAAAKIFALSNDEIASTIKAEHQRNAARLHVDDSDLKTKSYVEKIASSINNTLEETDLKLKAKNGASSVEKYRGKVRDRYDTGAEMVLVTCDRLSAFDRSVCQIPFKGAVLNLISKWWFKQTAHIVPNHVITQDNAEHANVTIGKRCKVFPIEFVMRGYITGSSATSMWTHYSKNNCRNYCGIPLPDGLKKHQKLWENLLTPTTKDDEHDELIDAETIIKDGHMTKEDWEYCAEKAKEIFAFSQKIAAQHGMILVDTKYEFGKFENGEIMLIDEINTPDSSRYWVQHNYDAKMKAGENPESIDKEFIRRWLVDQCDPYKVEKLPEIPQEKIVELSRRYIMLYECITGENFPFPEGEDVNAAIQKML